MVQAMQRSGRTVLKWFSKLSIRAKLTLIVMTTTCAALLMAVVTMSGFDELASRRAMQEDADATAETLASSTATALSLGNQHAVAEILGVLRANPLVESAAVYDPNGGLFASFIRPGNKRPLANSLPQTAAAAGGGRIEILRPVELNGERLGTVLLALDLRELDERRMRGVWVSLSVLLAAVGVGYLFAARLQRFISRPLLTLAGASHTVAVEKDYSIRVPKHADDELGQLVDGFNEMLSQIEARDLALKEAQAQLGRRVEERTHELFEANRSLRDEVNAHKLARVQSEALWKQLQSAYENIQREAVERTQMEAALRSSEERFSKAFRASPVALAILQQSDGVFVDVNDRFAELAGGTRESVIGQPIFSLPLWSEAGTRARIEQFLADGEPLSNWQSQIVGPGERKRMALLSAESFLLGEEPCVLMMTEDISERVNLEGQLRQAQKMEAIGQLAAGVAHDFNNLLTVIQGYTQLLQATQTPGSLGQEALGKIIAAIQRAAQLTSQLLTFSRKQVAQPKSVDLNKVVTSVSGMLRPLLGENVRLDWQAAAALPAILADAAMLEQVLVNLAVNARDAMPRGGDLVVRTSSCHFDEQEAHYRPQARAGQFVCLQVQDSGCGMDAPTMERIFDPFFTTKGVGKGTGLGLATVYGIVKQHDGWVEVTSQVGVGTTFKVFLPAIQIEASQTEFVTNTGEVRGGDETILLVEDEPALRELVTKVLRHYGYQVIEAAHGKQAIQVWRDLAPKPALLLTDMMMPEGMTGWELAEHIRGESPEVKVVFTSGYSPEIFDGDVKLDGRANFLPKPFHPRILARTVRECLDN
jgi:two-component system, cell cycle sensor histidine kinase and response regulator CckA